jgi:hypothetical protein
MSRKAKTCGVSGSGLKRRVCVLAGRISLGESGIVMPLHPPSSLRSPHSPGSVRIPSISIAVRWHQIEAMRRSPHVGVPFFSSFSSPFIHGPAVESGAIREIRGRPQEGRVAAVSGLTGRFVAETMQSSQGPGTKVAALHIPAGVGSKRWRSVMRSRSSISRTPRPAGYSALF